jgi:hypothetical protein
MMVVGPGPSQGDVQFCSTFREWEYWGALSRREAGAEECEESDEFERGRGRACEPEYPRMDFSWGSVRGVFGLYRTWMGMALGESDLNGLNCTVLCCTLYFL